MNTVYSTQETDDFLLLWANALKWLHSVVVCQCRSVSLHKAAKWASRLGAVRIRSVWAVRVSLTQDADFIEDVVNTVHRRILNQRARGLVPLDEDNFAARICTISRGVVRRLANRRAVSIFTLPPASECSSEDTSSETIAIQRDLILRGLTAIERLPPRERLVMRHVVSAARLGFEESGDDIATALCISKVAARALLSRARRKLREITAAS